MFSTFELVPAKMAETMASTQRNPTIFHHLGKLTFDDIDVKTSTGGVSRWITEDVCDGRCASGVEITRCICSWHQGYAARVIGGSRLCKGHYGSTQTKFNNSCDVIDNGDGWRYAIHCKDRNKIGSKWIGYKLVSWMEIKIIDFNIPQNDFQTAKTFHSGMAADVLSWSKYAKYCFWSLIQELLGIL